MSACHFVNLPFCKPNYIDLILTNLRPRVTPSPDYFTLLSSLPFPLSNWSLASHIFWWLITHQVTNGQKACWPNDKLNKWQVEQNDKLTKWQFNWIKNWPNDMLKIAFWYNDNLTNWQFDQMTIWPKMSSWPSGKLTKWQFNWIKNWPNDMLKIAFWYNDNLTNWQFG